VTHRPSLLVAALVLFASSCLLWATPAQAQTAKELGTRAGIQFRLGKFAQALALYEKAYELKPQPSLLFNIAQCHRHLGDLDKAAYGYKSYLAAAPEAPNRADVEASLAEVEREIAERRRRAEGSAVAPEPPPAPAAGVVAPPPPAPTVVATPSGVYLDRRGFYASLGIGGGLAALVNNDLFLGDAQLGAGWVGLRMGGYLGRHFALLGDLELFPVSSGVFGLIGASGQAFIGRVWLRFGGGMAFASGLGDTVPVGGGGVIGVGVEIFRFPQQTLGFALGLETTVVPAYIAGGTFVLWGIGLGASIY
jgi:hypothetical protein